MPDGVPSQHNTERCLAFIADNPGYHRPVTIAHAVGLTPHQAAVALRYLWECGRIDRQETRREGYSRPLGKYGVADGKVRPATLIPNWRSHQGGTATIVSLVIPPSKEKK
jgi:hypothetical protein